MLSQSIHARHRQQYMELMGPNSVAILPSPQELLRNGDANYKYRQCSDILYLTGFSEPATTVVLRPDAKSPYTLFVRPKDLVQETWEGRRAGTEGARRKYGADAAFSHVKLRRELERCIANVDELHYQLGVNPDFDKLLLSTIAKLRKSERRGLRPPKRIVDPRFVLHELRLHKSPEEIDVLRKAAAITAEAHTACMSAATDGMGENEIEALIDYTFRRRGGSGPGYASIVGSGANATILHYIENSQALKDGDLVLIDAGCEFDFYTADVTRTFPVNGRFSEVQKRCYQIVLRAQLAAIAMTKPGATIDDLHNCCVRVLSEGLIELGLVTASLDETLQKELYKPFYMHKTSHWLGLDVHDVGGYTIDGTARPLAPGMVLTIEPGLYIGADAMEVPAEYRGIGIRIEDDILVTATGCENLTAAIPKTVAEIEATC